MTESATSAHGEFTRERLEKEFAHDYSTSGTGIVPRGERRSLYHFIALWITLAAGFTYLFLGFQFYAAGYSLAKTVGVGLLAAACYLAYALPASYLGSKTGQTMALLTRSIFGRVGSGIVSLLLIGIAAGWIAFAFNLLAVMYGGLFSWGHVVLISVLLAVVGIANNLFGFTGITAFARYIVAPLMVLWIMFLVIKGFIDIPGHTLSLTPKASIPLPVMTGVGVAIGSVMWGNEPDTWRYGKPRFFWPVPAYLIAFAIGLVLFVIGGWMMAELSGAGPYDFGPAFRYTVQYSLFGALWLGAAVATIMQVAVNDGNYYEMINGGQNLFGQVRGWKRWYTCLIVMAVAVLATWWFVHVENGFFRIAGYSAIALPCATTVMCVDHFVLPRVLKITRPVEPIPDWRSTALGNWPAIVAVLVAVAFGAWGQVLLPGQTSAPALGIVPLEAWIMAGVLYVALAALVVRARRRQAILGFAGHARRDASEQQALPAEAGQQ